MLNSDVMGRATGFKFNEARGDSAEDGADVETEVAADAAIGEDRSARAFFDFDSLMTAIVAGDSAPTATDAEVVVNFGNDLEITVEVFGGNDVRKGFSDEIANRAEAVFFHENGESVFHVFDNAVAVLHDAGSDLEVFGAQEEELDGVHPGLDTADTGNRHISELGILFELSDVSERDGLHGCPGVTGDRGFTIYDGHTGDMFEIDIADRFNGIDGGDCISAAVEGTARRILNMRDIGGHFSNDG